MPRKSVYLDNLRRYDVTENEVPEQDVESLRKQFSSLEAAIDATPAELGASHYKKAKQRTLTIKNIKRRKLPDLMAVFEKGIKLEDEEEQDEASKSQENLQKDGPSSATSLENPQEGGPAPSNSLESVIAPLLIQTDKDLAVLMVDVIHEVFYNPKTGLWPTYDAAFDVASYRKAGKPGWDSPEDTPARLLAREEINRLKNLETTRIMEGEFGKKAVQNLIDTLLPLVSGLKAKEVKHAIRNHVRDHLNRLVFPELSK